MDAFKGADSLTKHFTLYSAIKKACRQNPLPSPYKQCGHLHHMAIHLDSSGENSIPHWLILLQGFFTLLSNLNLPSSESGIVNILHAKVGAAFRVSLKDKKIIVTVQYRYIDSIYINLCLSCLPYLLWNHFKWDLIFLACFFFAFFFTVCWNIISLAVNS